MKNNLALVLAAFSLIFLQLSLRKGGDGEEGRGISRTRNNLCFYCSNMYNLQNVIFWLYLLVDAELGFSASALLLVQFDPQKGDGCIGNSFSCSWVQPFPSDFQFI